MIAIFILGTILNFWAGIWLINRRYIHPLSLILSALASENETRKNEIRAVAVTVKNYHDELKKNIEFIDAKSNFLKKRFSSSAHDNN